MFKSRLEFIAQRIWPGALFALGVTFLTPALFGSTCRVGTLTSYESGVNFGCTLGPDGGYTMDFESFTSSGVDLLSADEIVVTPSSTATSLTFEFSAANGYEFAGDPGFTNTYIFQYDLDPPRPKLSGASINTGPGDPPNLSGLFCGDGIISGSTCEDGTPLSIGPMTASGVSQTSAIASFPTPVTDMDNQLTLVLDPCESIENFGATAYLATPEPSSLLWLTPGLLAFVWLRKKRLANGQ
jgi:hypothetical protein